MQCSLVERHQYLEKPTVSIFRVAPFFKSISRRQQDPLKCC